MGMFDTRVGELKSPRAKFAPHPQISGKNGGESLNLHQFARDGVVLLGHVRGAQGGQLTVAPDMKQMLAQVDQFELDALKMVDSYIVRMGLNAPAETVPQFRDGYEQEELGTLNFEAAGIKTVIWAAGYKFDFSFVKLPVTDEDGYPVQTRGVTEYEGLYFLGIPWLHSRKSGILFGVGDDAAYLAAHIALTGEERLEAAA
jgi:putative flavoprotein involved in K+ transport